MRQLRLLSVLTAVVALLCGCATQVMSTVLVSAQATRPQAVPPAPAGWTTVFKDDFTGRAGAAPSAKNWFYDIGTGYGTGEIEQTTSSTRNVYVDGHGHLVLKATRGGGTWRSGRIESTRDDFAAPPRGQLELTALIKQPAPAKGLGYWPAFWALGSPMRTGGGWPASGEIDMMEDVNGLNEASQTLHDAAGSSGHPLIACRGSRCESGYHTYSVIINRANTRAEYLRFLMDGRVTDTITEASVGAAAWHEAIDHGFFIIFDLAMGGNYPDGECDCTSPASATTPGAAMSVAYVAVYEKGGNSTPAGSPLAQVRQPHQVNAGDVVHLGERHEDRVAGPAAHHGAHRLPVNEQLGHRPRGSAGAADAGRGRHVGTEHVDQQAADRVSV